MTYIAKAAVCSEISTEHSTQNEHHLEFLNVNLLAPEVLHLNFSTPCM